MNAKTRYKDLSTICIKGYLYKLRRNDYQTTVPDPGASTQGKPLQRSALAP